MNSSARRTKSRGFAISTNPMLSAGRSGSTSLESGNRATLGRNWSCSRGLFVANRYSITNNAVEVSMRSTRRLQRAASDAVERGGDAGPLEPLFRETQCPQEFQPQPGG